MDVTPEIQDFADTAAVISYLDLVVTVDTAVAHLAGALAKPGFMVIPFAPDWRWLSGGSTSPWYPTMQLFRQTRRGSWDDALDRVRVAVAAFVTKHATGTTPGAGDDRGMTDG
jgi:ADP-heptose:LPS heptosyltransferase